MVRGRRLTALVYTARLTVYSPLHDYTRIHRSRRTERGAYGDAAVVPAAGACSGIACRGIAGAAVV